MSHTSPTERAVKDDPNNHRCWMVVGQGIGGVGEIRWCCGICGEPLASVRARRLLSRQTVHWRQPQICCRGFGLCTMWVLRTTAFRVAAYAARTARFRIAALLGGGRGAVVRRDEIRQSGKDHGEHGDCQRRVRDPLQRLRLFAGGRLSVAFRVTADSVGELSDIALRISRISRCR